MTSTKSRIILFILQKLNTKYSFEHYFKRGKLNSDISKKHNRKLKSVSTIDKRVILGRDLYTITPKILHSNVHILYFHGGAYVLGLKNHHYNFISRLIKIVGCKVTVPDYPLAPKFTSLNALMMAFETYKSLLENSSADKIVLMGDSSGGGLVLGLAQYLRSEGYTSPNQIILLSPWLDVTMENPEIQLIDKHDPILSIEGLIMAGKAYAGTSDLKDPYISPIYGEFDGIAPITLFTSTNDILNADARKFKSTLEHQGVKLNYIEFMGLFHDWVLFDLEESKHVVNSIAQLIIE